MLFWGTRNLAASEHQVTQSESDLVGLHNSLITLILSSSEVQSFSLSSMTSCNGVWREPVRRTPRRFPSHGDPATQRNRRSLPATGDSNSNLSFDTSLSGPQRPLNHSDWVAPARQTHPSKIETARRGRLGMLGGTIQASGMGWQWKASGP